jgi:DNA-binding transcriptional MerR regulator
MTQWYVKDLSKLTQISVQTLHHYDRIGLLEPSVRLANGYRVYSEKDLLKLQQIIALKFFGFELSQIKALLAAQMDVIEHFSAQSQFLEDKAKTLLDASNTLKSIISDSHHHKSIPWETIIKLIEVYRMTRQLEKSWAGKVLNSQELKDFASLEHDLKTKFTETDKKNFEKNWFNLVRDIETNLDKDPSSQLGIELGKRCMDLVNSIYGKKYINLRNVIWEKGFKSGHACEENGLSPASVAWLDKAFNAYYRGLIYGILDQVGKHTSSSVVKLWEDLVIDICGDDQASKKDLIKAALEDSNVSLNAKAWLANVSS